LSLLFSIDVLMLRTCGADAKHVSCGYLAPMVLST